MRELIRNGYIGNPAQLVTLRRVSLCEGRARGTEMIEVKTAGGLELDILPDAGLDIGQCRFRGVNMSWIWKQLKNGSKVKFVIWEDWQGRQMDFPADDTPLYYNPDRGQYYHRSSFCYSAKAITFQPFSYGQLEEEPFSKLTACPFCAPPARMADIQAVNDKYAAGGDHDELLTSLREGYYEYLSGN